MTQGHDGLQERFSRQLAMLELFRYTTINSLAGYLNQAQDSQPTSEKAFQRAGIRLRAGRKKREAEETRIDRDRMLASLDRETSSSVDI
jgi:hypothetical protein